MGIMTGFKDMTKDLFYGIGICKSLLRFSSVYRHPRLLILMYHRVCPPLGNREYLGIHADIFEQHMRFVRSNFKVVSMEEGLKKLYEKNGRGVYAAVNFDDGYMDNYLYAYPALKKYGIPATIFLTTDYIGKPSTFWWDRVFDIVSSPELKGIKIDMGPESLSFDLAGGSTRKEQAAEYINKILRWKSDAQIQDIVDKLEKSRPLLNSERSSQMLGWEEIRQMKKNGINFGSHTRTHRNLCLLKDSEVREELTGSKKAIEEELGEEVREFSYPFGVFDERIRSLVIEAGFSYARVTSKAVNNRNSDRFLLSCINAGVFTKTSFLANRVCLSLFKS